MTYSSGYSDGSSSSNSDSSVDIDYNVSEVVVSSTTDNSNNQTTQDINIKLYNEDLEGIQVGGVGGFSVTTSSRSVQPDVNMGGYNPMMGGAIDYYECQQEYGSIDGDEIKERIRETGRFGPTKYDPNYVNLDADGDLAPQFGHPCVNIPTPGGWDYVDYTYFSNFGGDLGQFVIPLRTTEFGPPLERANYKYSNARTNKGEQWHGSIEGDLEVDFNLVLREGKGTQENINEETLWQSGPRGQRSAYKKTANVAPSTGGAGSECTPGKALDPNDTFNTAELREPAFEIYASRNAEQTWDTKSWNPFIGDPTRQLVYVNHHREEYAPTTPDFGVYGVSGWLYGLQTQIDGDMEQEGVMDGFTPKTPHGGTAINYVYGMYKKDKTDEELEQLEADLSDYKGYIEDIIQEIQEEQDDSDQYNASYAYEPDSEYRLKPNFLGKIANSGLLDRQRNNILKDTPNSHLILQFTFEYICSKSEENEGVAPHEKDFPYSCDRLCEQLASRGEISMETVLDYMFAAMSNVPDEVIQTLGYIPRLRDLADFQAGLITDTDPGYFRFYLYNFILWACRPDHGQKFKELTFEKGVTSILHRPVLPIPTIWWQDGTWINLDEWMNYETGGWEEMCLRNGGIITPRVLELQDGSKAYNELVCYQEPDYENDQRANIDDEVAIASFTSGTLNAISGPLAVQRKGADDVYDDLEDSDNIFYEMRDYRKKILRSIYKSWSNAQEPGLRYEIDRTLADNTFERNLTDYRMPASNALKDRFGTTRAGASWKPEYADENDWPLYTQWWPSDDRQLTCFWQEGPGASPTWTYFDRNSVLGATYEFQPYQQNIVDPPNMKEMITYYIWITYNDRYTNTIYEVFDEPIQKPNFCFWWGDNPEKIADFNTGGQQIKLESIINDNTDKAVKFFRIQVPSGQKAGRENRFFRIGAYYPKSPTNLKNDPAVMGKLEDWKFGQNFKFEIRPARKDESEPTKNPNKGPVYHADYNETEPLMLRAQPRWFNKYWKNPLNYVKVKKKKLNKNKWYKVRWDPTYISGKSVVPHCRFWWGADENSYNPYITRPEDREGLYMSSAQALMSFDEDPYFFKPTTNFLFFGGFDSGRKMDKWSDDGEPWVIVEEADKPRIGPSYWADYGKEGDASGGMFGDIKTDELRWQEQLSYEFGDDMPQYVYATPHYIRESHIYDANAQTELQVRKTKIQVPFTKSTRVWRFKRSANATNLRDTHRFQYAIGPIQWAPKLAGQIAKNKYNVRAELPNAGKEFFSAYHTFTPVFPATAAIDQGIMLHDASNFVQWGRSDCKNGKVNASDPAKVERTLKNWSRLGEPAQLTSIPCVSQSGPFYWALGTENSGYMEEDVHPGKFDEFNNHVLWRADTGDSPGVVNIYHRHWPGQEAEPIIGDATRFCTISQAHNHKYDPKQPEGPKNLKSVDIKKGKRYKFIFPKQEDGLKILDQTWQQLHKQDAAKGTLGYNDSNLKYNLPMNMQFRVNWMDQQKYTWNVPLNEYHSLSEWTNRSNSSAIGNVVNVSDEVLKLGEEKKIKALGQSFIFGVSFFEGWRQQGYQMGPKTFKNGDSFDKTDVNFQYMGDKRALSMFNWSPYGIDFPFRIETTPDEQGPEYYAKKGSVINSTIEAYDTTQDGEINFARKLPANISTDPLVGDYWNMPLTYWQPGKEDGDKWEELYGNGKLKAYKVKKGYMYKISYVKQEQKYRPWDSTFNFIDAEILKDNKKLIQRYHYSNGENGVDALVTNAWDDQNSRYFPDKGGYAKDKDGNIVKMEQVSVAGHVLVLATSDHLIMGAYNPGTGKETPFKTEDKWQKKGEQTHLKIEESTIDYWKDGWSYWASANHDEKGQANFFSRHWNLPLKHIAPGFIVEGDEYEVVAMPNMSPNIVYHLWWAPAGVENHFSAISDPILENMLKNSLIKDDTTIQAGTTIRVKAKGDRLLLAATNTGVIREDLWNPNAQESPIKIRRLKDDKPPFGPGYYGTRNESNKGQYNLKAAHWQEIWDWNSWLSFQSETLANTLDRFKRNETYRLSLSKNDYTGAVCPKDYHSTGVMASTRTVKWKPIPDHPGEGGASQEISVNLPDFTKYPEMSPWDLGEGMKQRVTLKIGPKTNASHGYTWLICRSRPTNNTSMDSGVYEQIIQNSAKEQTLYNVSARYIYVCTGSKVTNKPDWEPKGNPECFQVTVTQGSAPSVAFQSTRTKPNDPNFNRDCQSSGGTVMRAYKDDWEVDRPQFNNPWYALGANSYTKDADNNDIVKGKYYEIGCYDIPYYSPDDPEFTGYSFGGVRVWWSDSADRMAINGFKLSEEDVGAGGIQREQGVIADGQFKTFEALGTHMWLGAVDELTPSQISTTPNNGSKVCMRIDRDGSRDCQSEFDCYGDKICVDGNCVEPQCDEDADCPNDMICINGMCTEAPTCTRDNDCPGNRVCVDGKCVEPQPCFVDDDCPQGKICIEGECRDPECSIDNDCPFDQICVDGICEDPDCTRDSDCGPGEECVDGFCLQSEPNCTSDNDCPGNQVCVSGRCLENPNGCNSNIDCPGDLACIDGTCRDILDIGDEPCTSDNDCPRNYHCIDGNCVSPECTEDDNCPFDQVCIDGKCQDPECTRNSDCTGNKICIDGTCQDDPDVTSCSVNGDCRGNKICVDGLCQDPPIPDSCTNDFDCPGDLVCINGKCEDMMTPPECFNSGDCSGERICVDGKCEDPECTADNDCSGDKICVDGNCQDPPPAECTTDSDCGYSKICVDGVCVDPERPDSCKESSECPGDLVCVDGNCQDLLEPADCYGNVDCPGDQECFDGRCVDPGPDCKVDQDCPGVQVCIDGNCEEAPVTEYPGNVIPPDMGNGTPESPQDYEVIGAQDPQALQAGKGNSNNFTLYGKLTRDTYDYLDIKDMQFPEVVFSTINTTMDRTLNNWGIEGEEVFITTEKFGTYVSGPGYYGPKNGSQLVVPDFCNLHYLSPLNGEKVKKDIGYQIRRTKKDTHNELGTYSLFGAKDTDVLLKQHRQNSKFKKYNVEMPSRKSEADDSWKYFVSEGEFMIFGVHGKKNKFDIDDWSIDGEPVDFELKEVDVNNEEGPVYWANYDSGEFKDKVDWNLNHWIKPFNSLTHVQIKKIGGEVELNAKFEAGRTYFVQSKQVLDYDLIFYENQSMYSAQGDGKFREIGRLKAGFGDSKKIRLTPNEVRLYIGADNIPESDFRHMSPRMWSKKGVPCDLQFQEIDYMEGPGYHADHADTVAVLADGGPWFSQKKQEGNISETFRVQCPILQQTYWHNPITTFEGLTRQAMYEVKPTIGSKWPYTITFWETDDRNQLDPSKATQKGWKKLGETRKKGTTNALVIRTTGRYIIAGCQETGVALVEEDWSPKGMPIDLTFTRIREDEGPSYWGATSNGKGQTPYTNKHWTKFNYIGTGMGAPLVPTFEYYVSVTKSTKNKKYRHSIFQTYSKSDAPMTSGQSGETKYAGSDISKVSYPGCTKRATVNGGKGAWMIFSTHKFDKETGTDKNRSLTNWSPKGEFLQLSVALKGNNLIPDKGGVIIKLLNALSGLLSALLLLFLLFKYVPPTDWMLEFYLPGPKNEVFPSGIPVADYDPETGEGELHDAQYKHGYGWSEYKSKVKEHLPPHAFFWTAEPKWMNLYADEASALHARILGLRHHGYMFDVTNYRCERNSIGGIGFCNLTQTFQFGIVRGPNSMARRISLSDHVGLFDNFTSWSKRGVAKSSTGKSLDSAAGLTPEELKERDAHIKSVYDGDQDPALYTFTFSSDKWHKNSRRRWFSTTVNPQFFAGRQKWSNPNVTEASGKYAWPRVINTTKSSIYKRLPISDQDRWFRPAMCRSVDAHHEATVAIATMTGTRNWTKEIEGSTKQLKTIKVGENRDNTYSEGPSKDYKSHVGSVRSYEFLRWGGSPWPADGTYGTGIDGFMDGIFIEEGFTCYIYDYWKSTNTSHNHVWIMAVEEETTWPRNSSVEQEIEWYFGLKFTLKIDAVSEFGGSDPQQMVFMGINFDTENDTNDYHELYPTKETDYLFRFNGNPKTETELRGQEVRTSIDVEVWSTRKVRYNSTIAKLYWGFYLYPDGSGKPHYFGHNISNLKPLASPFDPTSNLIRSRPEWDKWKAEQSQ